MCCSAVNIEILNLKLHEMILNYSVHEWSSLLGFSIFGSATQHLIIDRNDELL